MSNQLTENVIGYIRISKKDQSTYSIPYQRKAISNYCVFNNLNLLSLFTDNGQSSYTFDRPNWIALEKFIKQQKGQIKYLLIVDHDRFSRNLGEELMKIDQLENRSGVKVLSVFDSLTLDTKSADTF